MFGPEACCLYAKVPAGSRRVVRTRCLSLQPRVHFLAFLAPDYPFLFCEFRYKVGLYFFQHFYEVAAQKVVDQPTVVDILKRTTSRLGNERPRDSGPQPGCQHKTRKKHGVGREETPPSASCAQTIRINKELPLF